MVFSWYSFKEMINFASSYPEHHVKQSHFDSLASVDASTPYL